MKQATTPRCVHTAIAFCVHNNNSLLTPMADLIDFASRAHLRRNDGSFTIVGFGSLVARGRYISRANPTEFYSHMLLPLIRDSASLHFAYSNYRPARVFGWQRVFNLAHAGNMRHEGTWQFTGEVASLAFMRNPDAVSHVVLLDVDDDGLAGFLKRESL